MLKGRRGRGLEGREVLDGFKLSALLCSAPLYSSRVDLILYSICVFFFKTKLLQSGCAVRKRNEIHSDQPP